MAQPVPPIDVAKSLNREHGVDAAPSDQMADLKVFWGPEICRIEYLMHLLDTGRIKDEQSAQPA
ncbi:MAG TPA: hypothetical protein VF898_10810 [Chloroflexota bacterium]